MDRRGAIQMGAGLGLGGLVGARPDQQYFPARGGQQIPGTRTGPLRARQVVVFGTGKNSGVFVYSPAPAAGNLIASVTAAAGTDPYGNATIKGIVSYSPSATIENFAVQLFGNSVVWFTAPVASNGAGPWTPQGSAGLLPTTHQLLFGSFPGGVAADTGVLLAANGGLTWTGGATGDKLTISEAAAGALALIVQNSVGPSTAALVRFLVHQIGDAYLSLRVSGDNSNRIGFDWTATNFPRLHFGPGNATVDTNIYRAAANLFGSDYIAYDNAGNAETWNAITFANGWSNSLGTAMQYRRVASPDNCVQLIGDILAPAGIAVGQAINVALPAAYRPAHQQVITALNTTGPKECFIIMGTTGVLTFQANAVAGDVIRIPGGNLIALTA